MRSSASLRSAGDHKNRASPQRHRDTEKSEGLGPEVICFERQNTSWASKRPHICPVFSVSLCLCGERSSKVSPVLGMLARYNRISMTDCADCCNEVLTWPLCQLVSGGAGRPAAGAESGGWPFASLCRNPPFFRFCSYMSSSALAKSCSIEHRNSGS